MAHMTDFEMGSRFITINAIFQDLTECSEEKAKLQELAWEVTPEKKPNLVSRGKRHLSITMARLRMHQHTYKHVVGAPGCQARVATLQEESGLSPIPLRVKENETDGGRIHSQNPDLTGPLGDKLKEAVLNQAPGQQWWPQ